jgi:hypothetical protein
MQPEDAHWFARPYHDLYVALWLMLVFGPDQLNSRLLEGAEEECASAETMT